MRSPLAEIMGAATVGCGSVGQVKGRLIAMKLESPKAQRFLVAMPDPDAPRSAWWSTTTPSTRAARRVHVFSASPPPRTSP